MELALSFNLPSSNCTTLSCPLLIRATPPPRLPNQKSPWSSTQPPSLTPSTRPDLVLQMENIFWRSRLRPPPTVPAHMLPSRSSTIEEMLLWEVPTRTNPPSANRNKPWAPVPTQSMPRVSSNISRTTPPKGIHGRLVLWMESCSCSILSSRSPLQTQTPPERLATTNCGEPLLGS